jgi:ATP-dependent helicase YprA (DUF1998 family)
MNPLRVSRQIERSYRSYLRSTFAPRREAWRTAFEDALGSPTRPLTRGPFLQATPPFEPGASVSELVADGTLSPRFRNIPDEVFPPDRPLHWHQERAIRKALGGRNLLIATGTGSGKTEAVVFPTIELLLREGAAGTLDQPGVRALLLYPMNALANDQVRRLRQMLSAFPEITFGRYVGPTKRKRQDALDLFMQINPGQRPPPNELLSREEMQEHPPHILITNYSMLEFLLLRPADSAFFDGDTGRHWKLMALDEAHVYDGADGAEIALLLRRVRERVVQSESGRLRCLATSATLGSRADFPDLASFGRDLFGELFEWEEHDETRQDIVEPRRLPLKLDEPAYELPSRTYGRLRAVLDAPASTAAAIARSILESDCPDAADRVGTAGSAGAVLKSILAVDGRVERLQLELERNPLELPAATGIAFGDPSETEALVDLVELAVAARRDAEDASLIPARYHFFIRGLEGAFVCLSRSHPAGAPSLRLSPFDRCPDCDAVNRTSVMFELGACRKCRAEYVIGTGDRPIRRAPVGVVPTTFLLLTDPIEAFDEDEETVEVDDTTGLGFYEAFLCPSCGAVLESDSEACGCAGDPPARYAVTRVLPSDDGDALKRCAACGSKAQGGEIVGRFLTDVNAPAAVVTTALYGELPISSDPRQAVKLGSGRKLLAFADSRQDAAFFPPLLDRTHGAALRRALMLRAIATTSAIEALRLEDIVPALADLALREGIVSQDDSALGRRRTVWTWLMTELLAVDHRQALDGVGLVRLGYALPVGAPIPDALEPLGLADEEARSLLELLLDTLRHAGVMTFPAEVSRDAADFAPRNRDIVVRGRGAESALAITSWRPERGSNRRIDLLSKISTRRSLSADPATILDRLWDEITVADSAWAKVLPATIDARRGGPVRRLAHDRVEFTMGTAVPGPWRCDTCRSLSWFSVADVCPTYHCRGTLFLVPAEADRGHYAALYESYALVPMTTEEHTAQWAMDKGTEVQTRFVTGDINVLSCSTTFELGVDVGEVEAVLLRNVPPTPANYVQRAGRAGRRTGAAAMVVTMAQRRNHDLAWFAQPEAMVSGVVSPPRIVLDNPVLARRHAHSVAFAAFQRRDQSRTAGDFFLSPVVGGTRDIAFIDWLRTHPDDLGAAIERILPNEAATEIDVAGWGWVEALVADDPSDPTHGWLRRAGDEVRGDAERLSELIGEAATAEDFRLAGRLKAQRRTLVDADIVNALARRNVLPKYGFPVDVVPLDLTGAVGADGIELDRDLRLAIGEYAPGGEVVAAKIVWRSIGLKRQPERGWPQFEWAVCDNCDAYRGGLTRTPTCGVCGSPDTNGSGTWVAPVVGFRGQRSDTVIGEAPVLRRTAIRSWFGEYGKNAGDVPFITPDGIRPGSAAVRVSRQGKVVVLNLGPGRRGFRICESCGFGEPTPLRPATGGGRRRERGHRDPMSGRTCSGTLVLRQLGHDFLTDVVEVRLPTPREVNPLRSALYALLEGAGTLGINRTELDGTLHPYDAFAPPALVLYDTVPGGAGHSQRIRDHFADVVSAAYRRVDSCECGRETSCYQCLRSYSNQFWHESLRRDEAAAVLEPLLG